MSKQSETVIKYWLKQYQELVNVNLTASQIQAWITLFAEYPPKSLNKSFKLALQYMDNRLTPAMVSRLLHNPAAFRREEAEFAWSKVYNFARGHKGVALTDIEIEAMRLAAGGDRMIADASYSTLRAIKELFVEQYLLLVARQEGDNGTDR